MTVEIKQLVIRAVVEPAGQQPEAAAPPGSAAARTEDIVERCVEEVLRRLDRKQER